MKIGGIELWPTAKVTVKRFLESDLQGMAAEMVYHLLFSLVPLLIFLTALAGFIGRRVGIGNVVGDLTDWLRTNGNLPASTVDVVLKPIEQVLENQTGGLLSVGAVVALWSGKNAIAALMKGLTVAYGVEEGRPWWKQWAIAIGLTIALGLAAVAASFIFVTGTEFGGRLATWLNVSSVWETAWAWLRIPLVVLLLAVLVSFFYWAGPDRDAPYRFLSVGSVLTVVLWGAATLVLGLYFQYLGSYVATYGVLGGLMGFLFWLYLMSLILLFGGQLNAILNAERAGATAEQAAEATRVDRGAARAAHQHPPAPAPPPPSRPSIRETIAGWESRLPSAEAAARRAMASTSGRDRRLRSLRAADLVLRAALLLAASAITAVTSAVLGGRNRS